MLRRLDGCASMQWPWLRDVYVCVVRVDIPRRSVCCPRGLVPNSCAPSSPSLRVLTIMSNSIQLARRTTEPGTPTHSKS